MAEIIGGIGTSHVPTIGVAYDRGKQEFPPWKPLFDGYKPVADWLAQRRPDVLIFFYNDHMNGFFSDLFPTFAVGVGQEYEGADEGAGRRPLPPIKGHPDLAAHLVESLVNDEFDIATFQERPIDHGLLSPLPLLWPSEPDWPATIIPVQINVVQFPLPTPMRCFKLGKAVRKAVHSYPGDLRVAVVGTGGLSHQLHGARTGFNNVEWDQKFVELLERDPAELAAMRHADIIRLGGAESVEVIMWLAMRGALGDAVSRRHYNYYLATTTGMAVALFEEAHGTGAAMPSPAVATSGRLSA